MMLVMSGCKKKRTIIAANANVGLDAFEVQGAVGPFAPAPEAPQLLPVGRWIEVGTHVVYSYVDTAKGLTVRWDSSASGPGSIHLRRLTWAPAEFRPLSANEVRERGLEQPPAWLANYREQPPPGSRFGTWRNHAALVPRLHPDFPDDLKVLIGTVEDGNVTAFETLWLGLRSCADLRCEGALLNQPTTVPMQLGDALWFDLAGVAADRLPVAMPEGTEAPPELLTFAATSDRTRVGTQDDQGWVVDHDTPAEDRLVPIQQWVAVGSEVAFVFLGPTGPKAVVVNRGDTLTMQILRWRPQGMRVLTDEERLRFDLPATLEIEGAPPQPEPGLWGHWRVDPEIAWVFTEAGDPDLARVQVQNDDQTEAGAVRVTECGELRCRGRLQADAAGLEAGAEVQFLFTHIPDNDVPMAWTLSDDFFMQLPE